MRQKPPSVAGLGVLLMLLGLTACGTNVAVGGLDGGSTTNGNSSSSGLAVGSSGTNQGATTGNSISGSSANTGTSSTGLGSGSSTSTTTGGSTGAPGSGSTGINPTSGTASGSAGSTGGSGTGGLDGGSCDRTGDNVEFVGCSSDNDCVCPLDCLEPAGSSTPDGGLCLRSCVSNADCTGSALGAEYCSNGVCLLVSLCSLKGGYGENAPCQGASQCNCPFLCTADLDTGTGGEGLCKFPCQQNSDCHAGEGCYVDGGYCVGTLSCSSNGGSDGGPGNNTCLSNEDCSCPQDCLFGIEQVGYQAQQVDSCKLPCQQDSDCPGEGNGCYLDGGYCVPGLICQPQFGPALFQSCNGNCNCPLSCVSNPAVAAIGFYPGSQQPIQVCEACDGGVCQSIPGSCNPNSNVSVQGPCTSNIQCACPQVCAFDPTQSELVCRLYSTCSTDADCPDSRQSCQQGGCVDTNCDFLGQQNWQPAGFCGPFQSCPAIQGEGYPCNSSDPQGQPKGSPNGTCFINPVSIFQNVTFTCARAGEGGVGTPCSPPDTTEVFHNSCGVGLVCEGTADGGICVQACDSSLDGIYDAGIPGTCPLPQRCLSDNANDNQPPTNNQASFCVSVVEDGGEGCFVSPLTWTDGGDPFVTDPPNTEFASCSGIECACPLVCQGPDLSGRTYCAPPCANTADCPNAYTSCVNGFCQMNDTNCQIFSASPGSSCEVDDGGGTCIFGSNTVLCRRAGSTTGSCDPISGLCPVGQNCVSFGDGGPTCQTVCGNSQFSQPVNQCAANQVCAFSQVVSQFPAPITQGICLTLNDAGCVPRAVENEFAPCFSNADCACGLDCTYDSSLNTNNNIGIPTGNPQTFCERACSSLADCPKPYQTCSGEVGDSHCGIHFCVSSLLSGSILPGTYGEPCDVPADPGTCLIPTNAEAATFVPPNTNVNFGLCYAGGTSEAACSPTALRTQPTLLCAPGWVCSPAETCEPVCDPSAPNDGSSLVCPPSQYCQPFPDLVNNNTSLGFCSGGGDAGP